MTRPATCHPDRAHHARGQCRRCYQRDYYARRCGPRRTRRRADVVEDYQFLRRHGYSRQQIADRIGMTRVALDRALSRARRAGLL